MSENDLLSVLIKEVPKKAKDKNSYYHLNTFLKSIKKVDPERVSKCFLIQLEDSDRNLRRINRLKLEYEVLNNHPNQVSNLESNENDRIIKEGFTELFTVLKNMSNFLKDQLIEIKKAWNEILKKAKLEKIDQSKEVLKVE